MGSASRAKGLRGEREVAAIWTEHGFTVRGLESGGDHLCIVKPSIVPVGLGRPEDYAPRVVIYSEVKRQEPRVVIHSEVKRQERLQLWHWIAQTESEAPPGAVPVVSFRRNRSPWYAAVRLETLAELLS